MSGRIQPNRVGYSGYGCSEFPPFPLYEMDCMDCSENRFYELPDPLAKSTNCVNWDPWNFYATYGTVGHEIILAIINEVEEHNLRIGDYVRLEDGDPDDFDPHARYMVSEIIDLFSFVIDTGVALGTGSGTVTVYPDKFNYESFSDKWEVVGLPARPTCENDGSTTLQELADDYNMLETDYIGVPPVRTRGLSLIQEPTLPNVTCSQCYTVDRDEENDSITTATWLSAGGTPVDAEIADDGSVESISVPASDVDSSVINLCEEDLGEEDEVTITTVVFELCPRDVVPDSYNCGVNLLAMDDVGLSKGMKFNFEDIPCWTGSGKIGLIADSGCLQWLPMEECPEE